jgi:hypothetical protein
LWPCPELSLKKESIGFTFAISEMELFYPCKNTTSGAQQQAKQMFTVKIVVFGFAAINTKKPDRSAAAKKSTRNY